MKSFNIAKTVLIATFALGTTLHALAQAGTAEVAAGGGFASYHANGSSSNKGKFDASISYNFLKTVAVGFEYGYTPIASVSTSGGGFTTTGSANLQTFGGVVRVGFLDEVKVQPYVLGAGGGAREKATATASGGGVTYTASDSETGGYVGFGGGVNARLGGGFGVRPEVRYQRVSVSGSGLNEFDVTGTLFYTFGGRHKK